MKDEIRSINRQCIGVAIAIVVYAAAFIASVGCSPEKTKPDTGYAELPPPVAEHDAGEIIVPLHPLRGDYMEREKRIAEQSEAAPLPPKVFIYNKDGDLPLSPEARDAILEHKGFIVGFQIEAGRDSPSLQWQSVGDVWYDADEIYIWDNNEKTYRDPLSLLPIRNRPNGDFIFRPAPPLPGKPYDTITLRECLKVMKDRKAL